MLPWKYQGQDSPSPQPDNRDRCPKSENGSPLGRSPSLPLVRGPPDQPDREPLTSERMTLTMRNALDTSVVTCPGEGRRERGKASWGVSPLPRCPSHQPRQGPHAARRGPSYRNHPPVPKPQHRVAQEQSREAEECQDLVGRRAGDTQAIMG